MDYKHELFLTNVNQKAKFARKKHTSLSYMSSLSRKAEVKKIYFTTYIRELVCSFSTEALSKSLLKITEHLNKSTLNHRTQFKPLS